MATFTKGLKRVNLRGRRGAREDAPQARGAQAATAVAEGPAVDIAPNDPIVAYFQSASGVV